VPHPVTGRSPAELLFNRKIRTKLPDNDIQTHIDQEVRDRDCEQKAKSKEYTDVKRNASYSDVVIGDTVLLKQDKANKLSTTFENKPYKVIDKSGSSVVVEGPHGGTYHRDSTHVKKYIADADSSVPQTARDEQTTHVEQPLTDTGQFMDKHAASDIVAPPAQPVYSPRPTRARYMPRRYDDFVMQ
jgi:hypothetical protein